MSEPHHACRMLKGLKLCKDGITRNSFLKEPPEVRFWRFVDKRGPDECWLWTGNVCGSTSIYSSFWDGEKTVKGHRFAYELVHGKIPDGLLACHKCDVKLCVNPDHIFPGTSKDNSQDAKRKGRLRPGVSRGEDSGMNKWKTEQVVMVVNLRKAGLSYSEIQQASGISLTSVGAILQGRMWGHLTGLLPPSSRRKHSMEQNSERREGQSQND